MSSSASTWLVSTATEELLTSLVSWGFESTHTRADTRTHACALWSQDAPLNPDWLSAGVSWGQLCLLVFACAAGSPGSKVSFLSPQRPIGSTDPLINTGIDREGGKRLSGQIERCLPMPDGCSSESRGRVLNLIDSFTLQMIRISVGCQLMTNPLSHEIFSTFTGMKKTKCNEIF